MLINLLIILISNKILINCLILKSNIENLNYDRLDCDQKYYQKLKKTPLKVVAGYENKFRDEYFITNKFILRRNGFNLNLEYSKHNQASIKFYNLIDKSNTQIHFTDAILPIKLTKEQSLKLFRNNDVKMYEIEKLDQLNSDYDSNKLNYRIFIYLKTSQKDKTLIFDYLLITQLNFKTRIIKKEGNNILEIDNPIDKLNIEISTIRFFAQETNSNLNIIEFSNLNYVLREYSLPLKNEQLDPIKLNYFNFLNCFIPFCDGGRIRGLINLNNKLFIFIENHYRQINQSQIFEKDDSIHDLSTYKNVKNIVGYPIDKSINFGRRAYVINLKFIDSLNTVIALDDHLYYMDYDKNTSDLIISNKKFQYKLIDGYIFEINHTFANIGTNMRLINIFLRAFKNNYLIDYKLHHTSHIVSSNIIKYNQLFKNSEILSFEAEFIAIVNYNDLFLTFTLFSTDKAFNFDIKNINRTNIYDYDKLNVLNFNIFNCFTDLMIKRFNGELPVYEISRYNPESIELLLIILIFLFVIFIIISIILIITHYEKKLKQIKKRKNVKQSETESDFKFSSNLVPLKYLRLLKDKFYYLINKLSFSRTSKKKQSTIDNSDLVDQSSKSYRFKESSKRPENIKKDLESVKTIASTKDGLNFKEMKSNKSSLKSTRGSVDFTRKSQEIDKSNKIESKKDSKAEEKDSKIGEKMSSKTEEKVDSKFNEKIIIKDDEGNEITLAEIIKENLIDIQDDKLKKEDVIQSHPFILNKSTTKENSSKLGKESKSIEIGKLSKPLDEFSKELVKSNKMSINFKEVPKSNKISSKSDKLTTKTYKMSLVSDGLTKSDMKNTSNIAKSNQILSSKIDKKLLSKQDPAFDLSTALKSGSSKADVDKNIKIKSDKINDKSSDKISNYFNEMTSSLKVGPSISFGLSTAFKPYSSSRAPKDSVIDKSPNVNETIKSSPDNLAIPSFNLKSKVIKNLEANKPSSDRISANFKDSLSAKFDKVTTSNKDDSFRLSDSFRISKKESSKTSNKSSASNKEADAFNSSTSFKSSLLDKSLIDKVGIEKSKQNGTKKK